MIQRSDRSLNGILNNLKLMRYTYTLIRVCTTYYIVISLIKIVAMLCCILNLVHMVMVTPVRLKIINCGS